MTLLSTAIAPFRNALLRLKLQMFQHEHDTLNLGIASAKVPPSWSPERDKIYPLRTWIQDVRLWAVGTDVEENKQGPVVAMRIGGTGKELVRELDVNILSNGMMLQDPLGNLVQTSGLECLIRAVQRRFGPLEQELEIHVISELLQFRRKAGEDTDSVISRFSLTKERALQGAGFDMSWVGFAFLLLTVLGINKSQWPLLLAPTQGALPRNQQEYDDFVRYVRRQGHLTDKNVDEVKNMAFMTLPNDPQTQMLSAFPMFNSTEPQHFASSYPAFETDNEPADDNLSSCNSGMSVPDLSDVAMLPANVAGEQLYLGYRHHKRRWRKFSGGNKRQFFKRRRPFGKGKGKGKGKGNSKFGGKKGRMFFLDETSGVLHEVDAEDLDSTEDSDQLVYLGNGKFKRSNPKGKDGKKLRCSLCNSEEHLIRHCPQNTKGMTFQQHQQQHGNASFMTQPIAEQPLPTISSSSSSATTVPNQWCYFAGVANEASNQDQSFIEIDGAVTYLQQTSSDLPQTTEQDQTTAVATQQRYYMPAPELVKRPTLSEACSNKSSLERQFAFAWFMPYYHTKVRCKDFEGLLVDVGAIGNLCGSEFFNRVTARALKFGQSSTTQKLQRTLEVEGVGKESEKTQEAGVMPICLSDGRTGTFTAPVIPNSELPALLGLNTLHEQRAVIDCFNRQIVFIGPGGYQLKASPGSRTYKLHAAETGHLLLPCDCWEQARIKPGEKQLVF